MTRLINVFSFRYRMYHFASDTVQQFSDVAHDNRRCDVSVPLPADQAEWYKSISTTGGTWDIESTYNDSVTQIHASLFQPHMFQTDQGESRLYLLVVALAEAGYICHTVFGLDDSERSGSLDRRFVFPGEIQCRWKARDSHPRMATGED